MNTTGTGYYIPARIFIIPSLILLVLMIVLVPAVMAANITITPTSLQGWAAANVRADATIDITTTEAHSGTGSLEFNTNTVTPGQDKADFQITWNPATYPTRTLANLGSLSYDFFRDSSSTTAAHFHPVMRILWYFDNATPGNTADDQLGVLVWEGIYQAPALNPVPTDTWLSRNVLNQRFWMYITGGGVVQNYNSTLADWLAGTPTGQPGDPTPPNFALAGSTTYVYGISVGVGSGWGATFRGFVDNVIFGFNGQADTYNFETAVMSTGSGTSAKKSDGPQSIPVTFPCEDLAAESDGAMTVTGTIGNVRDGDTLGNVYCHIINQDSQYLTGPAEIGHPALDMGQVVNAVDLFGLLPDGVPVVPFINPVRLCLRGSGVVYFLDAADAKRTVRPLATLSSNNGTTCVDVPISGTVILIDPSPTAPAASEAAPASESSSTALTDCRVRTTHTVRLRAEPTTASNILSRVPFDLTLTATARTTDWVKVIFMDIQGWISADYLSLSGVC